jgi:hypothetical protein
MRTAHVGIVTCPESRESDMAGRFRGDSEATRPRFSYSVWDPWSQLK